MNQENDEPVTSAEESVHELVAEFHRREDQGNPVSPVDFIAQHPEHADALQSYFDGIAAVDQMSGPSPAQEQTVIPDNTQAVEHDATVIEQSASQTANARVAADAPPTTFGRYRILKELGRGAMGAVYLAQDEQLDRKVALKIPQFGGAMNKGLLERFYREARAAGNLRHPGICPVYDVGEIDGQHFITMAFIEGRPLRDFSKSSKRQADKQTARVIRKIAMAMAEAHDQNVIHRDLKPANIMIDNKNEPVVMDFGLARRAAENEEKLTHTGTVIGTPAYMSPEQVDGDNENVGPPADIYSLGVVFYELLTGELPFQGNLMSILKQISMKQPRPPVELHADTDPFLQDLCLKMLAKDAKDRPESMHEVAKALSEWLQGLHAPTDESGMLETSRVPGRKKKKKADALEATDPMTSPGIPRLPSEPEEFPAATESEPVSVTELSATTVTPGRPTAAADQPPTKNRKLLMMAGLGAAALLLAGISFFINLGGKYDVKITVEHPAISLKVDGDDVLIDGAGSTIRLSAGTHTLRMERDGLEAELEEFTVKKDGANAVHVAVIDDRLAVLSDGMKSPVQHTGNETTANVSEDIAAASNDAATLSPGRDGNYILDFDGVDDFVELPDLPIDGAAPFTAEAWIKLRSDESLRTRRSIFNFVGPQGGGCVYHSHWSDGWWLTNVAISESQNNQFSAIYENPPSTWVHVAVTFDGKQVKSFLNGKKTEEKRARQIERNDAAMSRYTIGARIDNETNQIDDFFKGQIRGLRVLRGIRYDTDFDPPEQLNADKNTIASYHFDEGTSDVLKDSSGNNHHGKIVGAKWVPVADGVDSRDGSSLTAGLRFDEGDRVEIPGLNFDGTQPVTFEARVNLRTEPRAVSEFNVATIGGLFALIRKNWGHRAGWVATMRSKGHGQVVRAIFNESLSGHIAVVYDIEGIQIFFDGKPTNSRTYQDNGKTKIDELPEILSYRIGTILGKVPRHESSTMQGVLSEVRISNVARYEGPYEPQMRLEADEYTLALYHFDEGSGDVLHDSSGNGHHGKIVGAKWVRGDDELSPLIDLLALIDPEQHALDGGMQKEDGVLLTPRFLNRNTRVLIPFKPPEEYDIRLVAERKGNDRFGLNLGIVMGGNQATIDMDGGSDPGWCLSRIDGEGMHDGNVTLVMGRRFEIGEKNQVDVRVRRENVQVFFNDQKLIDWQGSPERLSLWDRIQLPSDDELFFSSQAEFAIHELTLTPVDEPSVPPRSTGSASAHPPAVAPFDEPAAPPLVQTGQFDSKGFDVCFSSDERYVLTVDSSDENRLKVFDAESGELIRASEEGLGDNLVYGIAVSPVGSLVAASSREGRLVVWDYETGELRYEHKVDEQVLEIEFARDGASLLFSLNHTVNRWHLDTGKQDEFDAESGVKGLAVSPDGKHVAITGRKTLVLHDIETGEMIWTVPNEPQLASRTEHVRKKCAFSEDGQRLAVILARGNEPCTLLVYDTVDGREIWKKAGPPWLLKVPSDGFQYLAGGRCLLSLQDGACLWDAVTGNLLQRIGSANWADVSPDGLRVVTKDNSGPFRLWRIDEGRLLHPGDAAKLRRQGTGTSVSVAPPAAVAPFDAAQAKAHQKAWADYLGLPVEKEVELPGGAKIAFVLIPPGEFVIGSTQEERERMVKTLGANEGFLSLEGPQHFVRITRPYYLARFETTQAQWKSVMGMNPAKSPGLDRPVEQVSWDDIQPFLKKLNAGTGTAGPKIILPTEAQWEHACRAGTTTAYWFGDDDTALANYEWCQLPNQKDPLPVDVGQLKANPWGLFDMLGNVREWCADAGGTYQASAATDPLNATNALNARVLRGGSRVSHVWQCRSANRGETPSGSRNGWLGFRLAMTIDTAKLMSAQTTRVWDTPEFQTWVAQVAGLSAEKQVEAVAGKLQELNPGFDGVVTHEIQNGIIKRLEFLTDSVTDISPVRALTGLTRFHAYGSKGRTGKLSDLSPLQGLQLDFLAINGNPITDLSPLHDVPLKNLEMHSTQVADLSPLRGKELGYLVCADSKITDLSPLTGMPLRRLQIEWTQVSSLSLLKGMPLELLFCSGLNISDLSPLQGMPLKQLRLFNTQVTDLSPLKGMPLQILETAKSKVTDLSPLRELPLEELICDFSAERDTTTLRSIRTLKTINGKPVAEFWKEVEGNDTGKAPPPAKAPLNEAQARAHQKAWADYLDLPVEKEVELPSGEKMVFMLIPPGQFLMGSTDGERTQFAELAKADDDEWAVTYRLPSEGPQHTVEINRPFYLGKHEVTQAQWQAVRNNNPSKHKHLPSTAPVEIVGWSDCQRFLARLNENAQPSGMKFVLPGEAQWEFGCRAGTVTPWHGTADAAALDEHAWVDSKSTHPVGKLKPNAWGLHDMHGNVWEWCADSEHNYPTSGPGDTPVLMPGKEHRVFRGGGWNSKPWDARAATRNRNKPDIRLASIGLRLAMTIDATKPGLPVPRSGSATNSDK